MDCEIGKMGKRKKWGGGGGGKEERCVGLKKKGIRNER